MRKIKFRIWNGSKMEHNVMTGFLGAFYVQGIDEKDSASMSPFNTKYNESTPVMQCTGLKDKNFKEIYEGDIFQYHKHKGYLLESFKGSVSWLESGWGYIPNNFPFKTHFSSHDELKEDFLYHVEVIGNIYENPELLK